MPGGGLYKRVEKATKTARDGPKNLTGELEQAALHSGQQALGRSDAQNLQVGAGDQEVAELAGPQDVCDVQAFTVWYWTEGPEPSFVPETMFMNFKEGGHKTGEPRLIVSLSSFEALSQAYVMSVEKEGVKAALLQEKDDLLQEVRVGYYKELQHLRELLDMAKEQMALARGTKLEESERKRMEEFERQVRETDVHYFNIVEYLEPELKEIMKDAVKQMNRHLMLENFNLRDRLALHEGTEGEEGLAERLITLLMGKGTTPAQIVKILAGMVSDKQQSDDFHDACRDILGISKGTLEKEVVKKRPIVAAKKKPASIEDTASKRPKTPAEEEKEDEEEQEEDEAEEVGLRSRTPEDNGKEQRALMKELQNAKDEIERLRAELERQKKQMEDERSQFEKEKAELLARAREAENSLKACEAKLDKAYADIKTWKAKAAAAGLNVETPTSRQGDDTPSRRQEEHDDTIHQEFRRGGVTTVNSAGGPSQKDLDAARRAAEEAEAKLRELEQRLRDAQQKIEGLSEELETALADAKAARAEAAAANARRDQSEPASGDVTPSASPTEKVRKTERAQTFPVDKFIERSVTEPIPIKPKKIVDAPMAFIDRDYSTISRSGEYSHLSGMPIAMVEEELKRERKTRIGLEVKTKEMTDKINVMADEKYKLDKEVYRYTQDLSETKSRLARLIEEDEADAVTDIQIFCRWLVRRYGNLQNGFLALDANRSGGLSNFEFCSGLGQMGWIKIVGRRLFQIIDQDKKGEIDMSDLQRVFERWADGQGGDDHILDAAEEDAKVDNKSDLESARERIRKLLVQMGDLETENRRLKDIASKMEVRAKGTKDGGEGMKNLERKADLMKEGYSKLQDERNDVTSKMTAAMWKCREAHILQVKYMRQAETSQESLKKVQKKYDVLRAAYKKKHGRDPDEPGFEFSMTNMDSLAQMSAALLTQPQMLKTLGSSFSIEEDAVSCPSRPLSPTLSPESEKMRCPKCSAVLRLQPQADKLAGALTTSFQHSASKMDLRNMLRGATAGSGDEAGGFFMGSDGEDSAGEKISAEDVINGMTDEELLFGTPAALRGKSPNSMVAASAKAAGTYKAKTEAHTDQHGKRHRWQLLFADAQDRRTADPNFGSMRPGSSGASSGMRGEEGVPVIFTEESMSLLRHAKQVQQGLWREAVPIEPCFAERDEELRLEREEKELRGAESVRVLGNQSFRASVGGAPVSRAISGAAGGHIYLGNAPRREVSTPSVLSMANIGSISPSQSFSAGSLRGPAGSMPTTAAGWRPDTSAPQPANPPPPSFLEANNLLPAADGSAEGYFPPAASSVITPKDKTPRKKLNQMETSPAEKSTTLGSQCLQIVGNDSSAVSRLSFNSPPPSGQSPVKASPKELPARGPPPTPPLTVQTLEASDFDEGFVQGHSMARGQAGIVGAWRRTLGKGDMSMTDPGSPPQALGAGLPSSPDLGRSGGVVKGGALRRAQGQNPTQLPTLTDMGRNGSKRPSDKLDKLMSSSMPDLGIHLGERPAIVRTPPLAKQIRSGFRDEGAYDDGASQLSPGKQKRTRKISSAVERVPVAASGRYGAGDGAAGAAPFEVPLLYVGHPPAPGQGHDASLRPHTMGASHTIPSGLRNQFMMAASALELGSHIQRHAAGDEQEEQSTLESPLIISDMRLTPRANVGVGRTLLS